MFYSYFVAALRNLIKHPLNAAINILGLSLGLACCIMLLVFITDQLSYDTQFTDHQRIHMLEQTINHGALRPMVSRQVIEALHANLPDTEQVASFEHFSISYTNDAGERISKGGHYTENSFFRIFDFPFVEGSPADALQQANDVVLTRSEAKNYFGNDPALGKTLALGDRLFRVSGVIADPPDQTHFQRGRLRQGGLGIIASVEGKPARIIPDNLPGHLLKQMADFDKIARIRCYLKLSPGVNRDQLSQWINELASPANGVFSFASPPGSRNNLQVNFNLRPIRNLHLSDTINTRMREGLFQSWPFIYAAAGLALAVLLISCINFINFTTARFSLRNLEIGLRKTLGAERRQIFNQFICETLALTMLAVIAALVIAYLGLPWFSNMIQIDLTQVGYATPLFFYCLAGLIVLTTFFAGFYPSLVLARVNPAFALGGSNQQVAKSRLRTVLTTLQFVFSIFLITVCFVAYHQITHLKMMDLGYDQENIAYFSHALYLPGQQSTRKELAKELENHPAVESTSVTLQHIFDRFVTYRIQGAEASSITLKLLATDENFFEHYQIKLAAGRMFRYGDVSEQSKMNARVFEQAGTAMLTLAGLDRLGIASAEEALGKVLQVENHGTQASFEVIGVVDAFPRMLEQQQWDYSTAMPDILYYAEPHSYDSVSVRFQEGYRSKGVEYLKQIAEQNKWPGSIIHFPSQQFEPFFQALDRILSSVALFAIIAVMVAVMGLYAMSAFVVERRTQEIGVRKVMGASVVRVVRLLLWDFSKPVLVAMAVALPLAYLCASQIIQYAAARIPLETTVFGIVPLLVILIALVSVSGHTVKAASIDPVRALRYE